MGKFKYILENWRILGELLINVIKVTLSEVRTSFLNVKWCSEHLSRHGVNSGFCLCVPIGGKVKTVRRFFSAGPLHTIAFSPKEPFSLVP